jgi:hypothetical protein
MSKIIEVLLMAAFVGLFQGVTENVVKYSMQQIDLRERAPSIFGWPHEMVGRNYPDGVHRCCLGGYAPTVESSPVEDNGKAICQRNFR